MGAAPPRSAGIEPRPSAEAGLEVRSGRVRGLYQRIGRATGELYDRLPLFWGVLLINAAILAAGVLLLVLTPVTVSFPIEIEQAIILSVGLVLLIAANAALLRGGLRPLVQVLDSLRSVELAPGDPQRLPEVGGREARAIACAVNSMLDRLDNERRLVSQRILTALEGERQRVGQELHDEIGQRLTGVLLELRPIAFASPEAVRLRIEEIQEDVRHTLEEVGQLAWRLRPAVLDDLGLVPALEAMLSGLEENADVLITRHFSPPVDEFDREVELAIFRIAQEAAVNAVRHSEATVIDVSLNGASRYALTVSDDGRGLQHPGQSGPGIQGMHERALLIGAALRIDSPGRLGGVTVALAGDNQGIRSAEE